MSTVIVPPRTLKPRLYFLLCGYGFAWWDVLRLMWRGCNITVEEVPD